MNGSTSTFGMPADLGTPLDVPSHMNKESIDVFAVPKACQAFIRLYTASEASFLFCTLYISHFVYRTRIFKILDRKFLGAVVVYRIWSRII